MQDPVTKRYRDHSSREGFAFTFYCDLCGSAWRSVFCSFREREKRILTDQEFQLHKQVWQAEHDAAFARANQAALRHFNRCPSCARMICDMCFLDLDIGCSRCVAAAQKK